MQSPLTPDKLEALETAVDLDGQEPVAIERVPTQDSTDPAPRPLAMASIERSSVRSSERPSDIDEAQRDRSRDPPIDFRAPLTLSADDVGLGRRNMFLDVHPDGSKADSGADATEPNAAPGIRRSVRDALHDRDVALGLGAGGPVVVALEDVARSSDAPMNSGATFEVTTDAKGEVTSVRVLAVSEAATEWERVAAQVKDALRGRSLRVPMGTGGVVLTVEVISRWQLPSGHDPDLAVSVLGVPVKKARPEAKDPQRIEILKPEVKVVESPAPESNPVVKLPQFRLQLTIFGTNIDPIDLVPRPLRVVHARVVREKVL